MHHIKNQPIPGGLGSLGADVLDLPDPNVIAMWSPWQLDFRQLEPGPMQTRIRVRAGQILTLLEIAMDRAVHQGGVAPPGTVTLGVPLTEGLTRWRGRRAPRDGLISFGQSDGFDGFSGSGFHGLTFSAPRDEVERLCGRLGIPIADPAKAGTAISDATEGRYVAAAVRLARRTLKYGGPFERGDEEDILAALLRASVEGLEGAESSPSRTRARAVRIALELMEARAEDNLPLSTICAAAGVSERTLNRGFNERFGIGPKAYYLRLRLGRMRRDLLCGEAAGTIADVANDWGFWHMGQLARDYVKQFGELPSQTRRRRVATAWI